MTWMPYTAHGLHVWNALVNKIYLIEGMKSWNRFCSKLKRGPRFFEVADQPATNAAGVESCRTKIDVIFYGIICWIWSTCAFFGCSLHVYLIAVFTALQRLRQYVAFFSCCNINDVIQARILKVHYKGSNASTF